MLSLGFAFSISSRRVGTEMLSRANPAKELRLLCQKTWCAYCGTQRFGLCEVNHTTGSQKRGE